jgi:hypothetical protein
VLRADEEMQGHIQLRLAGELGIPYWYDRGIPGGAE